jgi:hypothetical protein
MINIAFYIVYYIIDTSLLIGFNNIPITAVIAILTSLAYQARMLMI